MNNYSDKQFNDFEPTWLYIKQHKITGKKYFGKTTKDPLDYNGSGIYWNKHIKKHGIEHVETIWFYLFTDIDNLVDFATRFSEWNNIVDSEEWANLMYEDGLNGGSKNRFVSEETKLNMSLGWKKRSPVTLETRMKISKALTGKTLSESTIEKVKKSNIGKKRSDESKQRMSEAQINRKYIFTEEHRKKISKSKKGKKSSDETKRKISESNKGRICKEETKRKISEKLKGKQPSEITRQKSREKLLGSKLSDEHKEKISISRKGKKHSKESKDLMSNKRKQTAQRKREEYDNKNLYLWFNKNKGIFIFSIYELVTYFVDLELNMSALKNLTLGINKTHKNWICVETNQQSNVFIGSTEDIFSKLKQIDLKQMDKINEII